MVAEEVRKLAEPNLPERRSEISELILSISGKRRRPSLAWPKARSRRIKPVSA